MPDIFGILFVLIASLSFSTEGYASTVAFQNGLSVLFVIAARYSISALILWVYHGVRTALKRGSSIGTVPLSTGTWLAILIVGILGYGGTTSLLTASFKLIPTSLAIIILFAYPSLVAIGEYLLGWQNPKPRTWVAILFTFIGLIIITRVSWQISSPMGMLLAFLAAALNAAQILATRRFLQLRDSFTLTLTYVSSAAAVMVVAALAAGEFAQVSLGNIPPMAWLALLSLAIFPSLVSILFLNLGIERLGASLASIISTSEPVFATLLGLILLKEMWTLTQAIGGLLVFLGLLVVSWPEKQTADDSQAAGS